MTAEERRRFRVSGRVQGVGFRYWTLRTATGLGLRGTVRNATDGTVEVEAAGLASALDRLRDALLEGPGHAHVHRVSDEPAGSHPLPGEFTISR